VDIRLKNKLLGASRGEVDFPRKEKGYEQGAAGRRNQVTQGFTEKVAGEKGKPATKMFKVKTLGKKGGPYPEGTGGNPIRPKPGGRQRSYKEKGWQEGTTGAKLNVSEFGRKVLLLL